eukprot:31494-Pelagococcus_subviridis.AAC.6
MRVAVAVTAEVARGEQHIALARECEEHLVVAGVVVVRVFTLREPAAAVRVVRDAVLRRLWRRWRVQRHRELRGVVVDVVVVGR